MTQDEVESGSGRHLFEADLRTSVRRYKQRDDGCEQPPRKLHLVHRTDMQPSGYLSQRSPTKLEARRTGDPGPLGFPHSATPLGRLRCYCTTANTSPCPGPARLLELWNGRNSRRYRWLPP